MGIKLAMNMSLRNKTPLDDRQQFKTKAVMKAFSEAHLAEGLLSFCLEDKKLYQYLSENSDDETTGKWREFKQGSESAGGDGSSSALFTTSSPVNNPIGEFKSGDVINEGDNVSIVDAINKLLHKSVNPSVNFTMSPSATIYEIGTNVASLTFNAKVTKGTGEITSVELFKGSDSIKVFDLNESNSYSFEYTDGVSTDTTFKIVVTASDGKVEKELKIGFANKTYYGYVVGLVGDVDESTIQGLYDIVKKEKGMIMDKVTMQSGKIVYAIPAALGEITSIKDGNGFEYISSYKKTTLNISSVLYNVYCMKNETTVTNFKQIFT